MKFKANVICRFPKKWGFGINGGCNYTVYKRWANYYLELEFLFWVFGVELDWSKKWLSAAVIHNHDDIGIETQYGKIEIDDIEDMEKSSSIPLIKAGISALKAYLKIK